MNLFTVMALGSALHMAAGSPAEPIQADSVAIYYNVSQPQNRDGKEVTIDEFLNQDACAEPLEMYAQPYDSLVVALQEEKSRRAFDSFFNDFINIESVETTEGQLPDSVYEARLKMLLSPIRMPYNNIVKRYIITYTTRRRTTMENILGRSQYYFPMIEEELDRAGLPIELRMLPVIESALSPTAISRAGATGLWQFMYTTGRVYGLEINSFIDQRRDPVLATKAACRFLKDLYAIYGDWTLALAAYNCGPGNVNKAIKRAGNSAADFWDIYPYLPAETRGYVPSFIAATYAYTFHYHHDIVPAQSALPLATDTLMINRPMHFEQISSTIDIPVEVIRSLNPQYKIDIIPATGKSYALTLPMGETTRFLEHEKAIIAKDTVYLAQYLKPSATNPSQQAFALDSFTYRVKSGDTLSGIAKRHNVTVSQLMKWNSLKNAHTLKIGQSLEIYR